MSGGVRDLGSGARLERLVALLIAAIGALSLAACGDSSSDSTLPRNVVVPLSVVNQFFPDITQEASTSHNTTAVGNPTATRSVIYVTGDGAKKVTLTVDPLGSVLAPELLTVLEVEECAVFRGDNSQLFWQGSRLPW